MDVLVIGWSDIVRRRVLPALDRLEIVSAVHVATATSRVDLAELSNKAGRSFTGDGYLEAALGAFPSSVVYVSGTNVVHAPRALAALQSGHDVIVDKPAFLDHRDRDACLAAARAGDLLLAEATVWPFHSQVVELQRRLAGHGLRPDRISLTFTIPALPATNFRTRARLGGGAVSDMGAYAMSPGRVFGTSNLVDLTGQVTERSDDGLDLAFHMRADYAHGIVVTGTFSMNAPYENRIDVAGDDWSARLEPAFSSRLEASLTVSLTVSGVDYSFEVDPSDAFAEYLGSVLRAIAAGERDSWTERTAVATDDLLHLARTVGVRWPGAQAVH